MKTPRIDVIGLGPAGVEFITAGAQALITDVDHKYLRTARHPAAEGLDWPSFDHHYETLPTFEGVYASVVDDLVAAAKEHGRVLYAVPGSPRVAEHTVELLAERDDIELVTHAALSFLDLSWVALGIDPIEQGVRLVDGHRFAGEAAGERGPLLVAQCHSQQVLSDIKLSIDEPGEIQVTVLQGLGTDSERVFDLAWADLDREVDADHLTSIYIPQLPAGVGVAFGRFDELVKRLRQDCPWDADQTHASLRRYLLEESYETLEALDDLVGADEAEVGAEDIAGRYGDLAEELGDLLYQIFFHSILATEAGWFTVADVATGIHDKLYERHPHVFGDVETTLEDLPAQWEAAKRVEKGRESVMDGIPRALPALIYATKVQKKALAIGHEVAVSPLEAPAASEAEVGDLLFALVSLARELGVDPESALRQHASAIADQVRSSES